MVRHRKPGLWERLTRRRPRIRGVRVTIALVDLRTGVRHLLTPEAVAAGREGAGRYVALCGEQIVVPALTGWHEPAASHLLMLGALAGPDLLATSYTEALRAGYRWHEFGDVHLILPGG